MCGLIGVASTERLKNSRNRGEAFADGMWMNTLRGDHSTGFAAIAIDKEKEEPYIFKRAMNGPDFLSMAQTQRVLKDIEKFSMLLGHNRFSTIGSHSTSNAHPFNFGHITLTHNGHVNNAVSLLPAGKTCPIYVDSAQVAMAMSLIGEKEVLERATGAFAFVWHDAKDGTLNFARNTDRPLKFCYVKDENTMWWMSERAMLWAALDRNKIIIEGPMYNVPEKLWFKFNPKNLREYTTIPFVHRSLGGTRSTAVTAGTDKATTGGNTAASGTSTNDNKGDWNRGARIAAAQGRLITTLLAGCKKPTKKEIEEREFELKKNSSRPGGWKKVRKVTEKLATSGYQYDQPVVVDIRTWNKYSNQRQAGKVGGVIFNTAVPVHMSFLTMQQFAKFKELSVLLGKVVNIKPDKTGVQALIIEPHPLAEEFAKSWDNRWAQVNAARNAAPEAVLSVEKLRDTLRLPAPANDTGSPQLTHCGPGGSTISKARFDELTKSGCSICTGDISESAELSKNILWLDRDPVCFTCSTDPKNIAEFNLPKLPTRIH